jgi:hypothetical protein
VGKTFQTKEKRHLYELEECPVPGTVDWDFRHHALRANWFVDELRMNGVKVEIADIVDLHVTRVMMKGSSGVDYWQDIDPSAFKNPLNIRRLLAFQAQKAGYQKTL